MPTRSRNVPTTVLTSGNNSGVPVGGDSEVSALMKLLTIDTAKRLSYDRTLQTTE